MLILIQKITSDEKLSKSLRSIFQKMYHVPLNSKAYYIDD